MTKQNVQMTVQALTTEQLTVVTEIQNGYGVNSYILSDGFEYLLIEGLSEILQYHAFEGSPKVGDVWDFVQTKNGIEWADDNEGHNLPVIRVTIDAIEYV